MNKKQIYTLLAGLIIVSTLTVPTLAVSTPTQPPQVEPTTQGAVVRADEFITYHRINNGVKQYRIWNMTKAIWVTPWTNYE